MEYYTVTNLANMYLYEHQDGTGRQGWGTKDHATLYRTPIDGGNAGCKATNCCADNPFKMKHHNPHDLLRQLMSLFIEDHVYRIIELEGKGWEGPQVKKFAEIIQKIEEELE